LLLGFARQRHRPSSEARAIQAPDLSTRLIAETARCVRCGLCQPHCPTYALDRSEAQSPRGRITLARALALGQLDAADDSAALALDHCLACRRCEAVCPAGVAYDELLVDARTLLRRQRPPRSSQRWLERAVAWRWPLTLAWPALHALRRLLPEGRRAVLPRTAPVAGGWHRAQAVARGRLVLFTGCVSRGLDAAAQHATLRVLTRLGWDVWTDAAGHCCGALHRHAGDAATADRLGVGTRQSMPECDAVLVTASGCHADLRRTLRDGSAPVHELTTFLAADSALAGLPLRPGAGRVFVHTPCTQSSAVGQPDAARRLLARIDGLRLDILPDHGCCGAAGSHMLSFPDRAQALRQRHLGNLQAAPGDILCSPNIGCRLHLARAPQLATARLAHPVEILAEHLP